MYILDRGDYIQGYSALSIGYNCFKDSPGSLNRLRLPIREIIDELEHIKLNFSYLSGRGVEKVSKTFMKNRINDPSELGVCV